MRLRVSHGPRTLGAPTTWETVLKVTAGNIELRVTEFQVTANGNNPTEEQLQYRLVRLTTAGTFTHTLTPVKMNPVFDAARTILSSGQATPTGEPAIGDQLELGHFSPMPGLCKQIPEPRHYTIPANTSLAVQVNGPVAHDVSTYLEYSEGMEAF